MNSSIPKTPTPVAGLLAFSVLLGCLLATANLSANLVLFLTPVLVLTVTLAGIIIFKVDIRHTLLLRLPSQIDFVMALPLSLSFVVIGDQLGSLSQQLVPMPSEYIHTIQTLLQASTFSEWVIKIAIVGFAAAISEELFFRGFILNAFTKNGNEGNAVIFTSLLFMLLHPQFLPTFAASILLGFVAVATRSIVIPITIHFVNNLSAILLVNLAGIETLAEPIWIRPTILLPAIGIFVLTSIHYTRIWKNQSPELEQAISKQDPPMNHRDFEALQIPELNMSITQKLSSVSANRKFIGWGIVIASTVGGIFVIVSMLAVSVYYINPDRIHQTSIEVLQKESAATLSPTAKDKEPQLDVAFSTLSTLSKKGQLNLTDLVHLQKRYYQLAKDDILDAAEAELLIQLIQTIVADTTKSNS